jgi:hypothetical protein
MYRSKIFNYFFIESVINEYSDNYDIFVYTDDQLIGLSIKLSKKTYSVQVLKQNNFKSYIYKNKILFTLLSILCFFRTLPGVFYRYFKTRKINIEKNPIRDSSTLILSLDNYFPWNGSNDLLNDRIWNDLHDRIEANIAVIHSADPRNVIFVKRKNTISLLLLKTIRMLKYSLVFRIQALMICNKNIWQGFSKNTPKHLSVILGVYLLRDCLYKAPIWFECSLALKDFLFQHNYIKTVIFFGEFGGWGKMVAGVAKELGLKSIAYAHGFYFDAHLQYHFTKIEFKTNIIPDALLLWSKRTLEIIDKYAECKPPIYVVGTARIRSSYEDCIQQRCNQKKTIGVLPSTGEFPSVVEYILNNNEMWSGLNFLIKPHPTRVQEYKTRYEPIIRNKENISTFWGEDINQFFNDIDCIIIGCSTAGVEALRRCIPVVVASETVIYGQGTLVTHDPSKGVYLAEDPEDIIKGIAYFFNQKKYNCDDFYQLSRFYVEDLNLDKIKKILESFEDN